MFKLLGQSKAWADLRHLQTFCWMVIGLICSGCINLTCLSTYAESRAKLAQSHQRRFSRWLHNNRINVHRLYKPIIKLALADWNSSSIKIIEDTTLLWNQYCLVRLSVQYRGRAVVLGWRVLEKSSSSVALEKYQDLLCASAKLLPPGVKVIFLADRGFADTKLMRFNIEEEFLDEKSNGFQLEKSEIRSVMALSRLCLVVAVAALCLTSQGEQVVAHGLRRRVDCHWFRGNSYLRIGWDWLKAVVHKGWKLFPNMTLNGRVDPEPAIASRKQERKKLQREFTVKSFKYLGKINCILCSKIF